MVMTMNAYKQDAWYNILKTAEGPYFGQNRPKLTAL